MRRSFLAGVTKFALVVAALTAISAQAADYRLGTMDKLRIRVVEWQTAEGAVRDWSTISGEYAVGPSGKISLPLVGEMDAAGKTTSEIREAISETLQQKLGLLDRPDASVELAEFRPVFVSGDVQTPGKYPYAPDLTVLKAASLAGGIRRAADAGLRTERDFINARGNYEVFVAERDGLLAKRARLISEAKGLQEIDFPKELQETANGKKLIADESAFKTARETRLRVQLSAIEDLKTLLQSEVVSLEKKIASQSRQIELSRKELKGIGDLADKGLAVNSRVLSIERSTAELETKVLDMETAALRAKQDISRATQDATNLQNEWDSGVAQERQQAEFAIEQLNLKIAMYRDLMAEALARDPQAGRTSGDASPEIGFSIVREAEGKTTEMPAEENTPVLPGDVIKVGIAAIPAN
ncbi:polysaccharide biosynthesis/export family protein [Arvimicrobium flavum]|uniref:polysaccharide biosynthesis/export family protein n=1 Tax=Arvimicrobium flavum TaxID=3393320 RepID=UPI00237A5E87|nr:polysaccharide biosynthesis/export family protein [Mesorhizobium shangrilense]